MKNNQMSKIQSQNERLNALKNVDDNQIDEMRHKMAAMEVLNVQL